MKLQIPYHGSSFGRSRRLNRGFTLTEIIVAMTVFLFMVAGILAAHLFGLRMFQVNQTKLTTTEWSRNTFGKITDEVHAANSITILNGDTNGNFTGLLDGEPQQGSGLQIFPTTNTDIYTLYFLNASDMTFRRTIHAPSGSNTLTLADSITNTVIFTAQDLSGNVLTNNANNRVIHLTLDFYQPGSFMRGPYYYQLETSMKQRVVQ